MQMKAQALACITAVLAVVPIAVIAQAPPRDTRPSAATRVESLDELLPQSAPERNLAQILDAPGPPLRPGLNLAPPRNGVIRPAPPPGYRVPSADEALAARLCLPRNATAFATVLGSRVVTNNSRSELFTSYQVRIREWLRGKHEAEIVVGVFGGRVVVAGEDYTTPMGSGPRGSLSVGTSYVLFLISVGPGAYVLTWDPAAVATDRMTLSGRTESTAEALTRLRRLAGQCGKPNGAVP
jgi:hypothetical protein